MPRIKPYRPDFMAYGPHITVSKGNPLTFGEPEQTEADDEDGMPTYRYYESTNILGKLFRAINEQKIFSNIQKSSQPRGTKSSLLYWTRKHIAENLGIRLIDPHMERARGIRDE